MAISGERWRLVSPALDDVLDLPPEQRGPWLEALRERDAALAADVGALLAEHEQLAHEGFLEGEVERPPDWLSPADLTTITSSSLGAGALTLTADAAGQSPPVQGSSSGEMIKHYEIVRLLGQGGGGAVYLARDTKLGRLVALKRLLKPGDPGAERVLIEARATARCRHENIVVVHEVDEHEGEPYLVLEYVEGSTLRAWMIQRAAGEGAAGVSGGAPERVPPGLAIEMMVPVVRALACAHAQGVVHRDLKPENILLADAGPIKVVDFGIAKQLWRDAPSPLSGEDTSALDKSGLKGTRLYMAPEQWRGEEPDARVDLWAVGIMLYELCAGVHPLAPATPDRLARVADPLTPMPSLRGPCPELGALADVVDHCLAKPREARFGSAAELLAALEALQSGRSALDQGANPFPALSSFQEADAGRFFGRDGEVAGLTQMLRNQPLLALVGASGAGKSSLVRAGVIPALKRLGEQWEAFVLRPGRRPLGALAEVLVRAQETPAADEGAPASRDVGELVATLRREPGALGARLRARCRQRRGRALVFVDQFEELYTLGSSPDERSAFLACLEGVADDASSPLRVVLALRADFLDRLVDGRLLLSEVTRGLVALAPPGRAGLHDALARPVEAAGHRFESEALVAQIVDALDGTRSPLPLLQFLAAKLWEGRDREKHLLTEASYERLGGVAGALSAHADAVFGGLSAGEQRLCREVFVHLVTAERTRAVVSLDELRRLGPEGEAEGGAIELVVHRLVEARLLSLETDAERAETTVELVHESLIERWPQLGRWLEASEQDTQFLARVRVAAQQWEANGEAAGLLWREGAAAEARAWLERRRAERGGDRAGLGDREARFLAAVAALSERSQRRRQGVVAALVAALGVAAVAMAIQASRADRGATLARNAARMSAAREKRADPTTVIALLRELEPPDLPNGWLALADEVRREAVASVVITQPESAIALEWSPDGRRIATHAWDDSMYVWRADGAGPAAILRGHEATVMSMKWSRDGRWIVSGSRDGTARIFRADGAGEPVVLRGAGGAVYAAEFSPDGTRVVTASSDNVVRIWGADGRGEPLVLGGYEQAVSHVAWSPDGRKIAGASKDGSIRVFRADGAGEPVVLRGRGGPVMLVAWGPDSERIASVASDKMARVWRADGRGEPVALRGHEETILSVVFSPDGALVVTASEDRTARIWRADGQGEPVILRGHGGFVQDAKFSPDNTRVVTASVDGTARIWSADGQGEPLVLRGHEGAVWQAAFSPDGEQIASVSDDRTLRVWRARQTMRPVALRGHRDRVNGVAWSPDGRRVATASTDETARVWNIDGRGEPLVLRGHEGGVTSVAFSPDGGRLASSSGDKTVRVWRADGQGEPLVLRGHENEVSSVAFSPDGTRLVTASEDRTVRIWRADGAGEPLVLRGWASPVYCASFSPDGGRVVTASGDKTVLIWRADGTGEPVVLRGHENEAGFAAFSPDGGRVATGSIDKTARIWRADGTGEPIILRGHEHWVFGVHWRPDANVLATASFDKTVRLWRTDGGGAFMTLRHDSEVLDVVFSPDGERLASVSGNAAWVWSDLEPLRGLDDPKLWSATSYCPPAERRVALLNVPEAQARDEEKACRLRVEAAAAR